MRRAFVVLGLWLALASGVRAETSWEEGVHYFAVQPAQETTVASGKVEVLEVFSYACPACNLFYPIIDQLKAQLPGKAQLVYLPASWHPEEDWKTFQRAFFAAQSLGLVERTHDALFDAIWKTGELATIDPATHQPKRQMPTIVDVAQVYARLTGVSPENFLAAAHSFGVDASMRQADAQIAAYQADQTPTIIVNGRYRLTPRSAGGNDQFIALVKWLVAREGK
jgi:thiol:disulfide interchange protein DsbA